MNVKFKSLFCVALLTAAVLCAACPAQSQPSTAPGGTTQPAFQAVVEPAKITQRTITDSGVTVATLSNGLTVVVKTTRQAPVVCVRSYVRAGSIYEGPWVGAGISHLTEHLVAKGAIHDMGPSATAKEAQQTSDRVKEIGGLSNAGTSLDYTCYYIAATAGKTMDCIDLIADWMARPVITSEDFQREHGVVQRELEMHLDDPGRQLQLAHGASFFREHPAGVPIIGYKAPLAKLTSADVLAYLHRMYVPQNMVFCVVGDVDVEAVLDRVCRAFAGSARGRTPELSLPAVPHVSGVRHVVRTHKTLQEVMQEISFRTIPLIHDDLYALDVLAYVLTEGRSSRLARKIRRDKKLVTAISSSSWTPAWGAGMFSISFRAATAEMAKAAEAAILDELKSVAADGVEDDELTRAKRQKVADLVYSQQTVESIASTLCRDYMTAGDVDFSRNYTQRIQSVTTEDVQRMARKYFDFDAMVITTLLPEQKKDRPAAEKEEVKSQEVSENMFRLPNGLRVVLYPTDAVGLVAMAFVARGGLLLEDEKTNGLGTLMTALSTRGAGERTAEQIAEFFDGAGGAVSGNCGNNTFNWQATVLEDSFDEAMEIFADIIIRPRFSDKELEILRPIVQTRIKQRQEHWHGQLSKFFRGKFFTDSPYRLLTSGAAEVVAEATAEQITEVHRDYVRAEASVLAVYGNFDATVARKQIQKAFADLPQGDVEVPEPQAREVSQDGERYDLGTENEVAAIIVAAPGMKIDNLEDRFAIDVLDTIISGWHMPAGWLHSELRGKRLVYVVHAYNWAGLAPGAFLVYAACQPDKAEQVVEIIRSKLDKAAAYEPSAREIDLAVNSILTAELLTKQSMSALAMSAALDELYGFGYDFRSRMESLYRKITSADVLRVGGKYLGRGYVVTVTSPNADAVEQEREDK